MRIARVEVHDLDNVPIESPPFRTEPSVAGALIVEIETDDGIIGWSMAGPFAHPLVADFITRYLGPALIGEDPLLIDRIWHKVSRGETERRFGPFFTIAMSSVDIALWDINGKAFGKPVHHLLGGATDKVAVYVTHGAAYRGAPRYSVEELAAEAEHLVKVGNRHLKNTVGRQLNDNEFAPDPDDDYVRMKAVRDAVGPEIKLAMDANSRMTLPAAIRLCKLTEELNISFFEEPVHENEPSLLGALRAHTSIPIAAAENHKFSMRDLLVADAIDIAQPNVTSDGGYSGGMRIAALARAFTKTLGHGNGCGPHNIPLQAGVSHGTIVEYHYYDWMTYNAIFEAVPQPVEGYLHVSQQPGLGLEPKQGVIKEFGAKG